MEPLSPQLEASLARLGYSPLTDIQQKAIPVAVTGTDFFAVSPTGTGKTAAFIVPIIQKYLFDAKTKAIVVEPARELVIQAANECRKLAEGMNFLTVAVYGGTPPKRQEELLAKGPQVVIGTPGRLTELLQSGRLKPSQYSILVLDEADRLLSRQMVKEVMHLASRLPPGHQTMFFSVQMPKDALEHGSRLLKPGYKHVKAGKVATETVSHAYVIADNYARTLARLLLAAPGKSMAFCAKAAEADQLAIDLAAHGVHSIVLHSNLEPKRRSSAMRRFLDGSEPLLVCTDLAARGIHIEAVLRIYSVGLPSSPEFYLHRSGRTGRMGASGECISIITLAEEKPLKNIYASIGVSATKL